MHEQAVEHLRTSDRVLARLIRQVGPCRLEPHRNASPFQTLVQSVAHQQLNGTAANTILKRVRALFPRRKFPLPEELVATPNERLRQAGLSRAKIAAVKDIAAKTIEGVVPVSRAIAQMSNEEIIERLTTIRGVGPWTVEMLLVFRLGRLDILPATDFGVRKGFALTYRLEKLPTPAELLAHGERWRPYRTIASWYLWRALDRE
ncbi:MAG TPA: DNA-3-methyladenine glycosylase [Haliangiales bacterium]|nr:DNA-3-methyladenine glycosylase [Haliangiales bacterium]